MKAQKTPLQYFISELKKSKYFQRVINDVNQQNTFVTDVIKKAQDIEKQHLEMAFNAGADSEAGNTILTFEKYYLKIYKFKPIKKQNFKLALEWWSKINIAKKEWLYSTYFVKSNNFTLANGYNQLTNKEIEEIWRKEELKCKCKKAQFTRTVDTDFNPLCGKCGKAI